MADRAVLRFVGSVIVGALVACTGAAQHDEVETAGAALEQIPAEALVVDRAASCPAPFDGSGPRPGANAGFVAGGQSRRFELLAPPSTFTGPRPILFAFHGTSENGA